MMKNYDKNIPGVGTYDTSFYDIKKTKKGFSLGKSHRFNNNQVRGGVSNNLVNAESREY
jgi:hypothetical protein